MIVQCPSCETKFRISDAKVASAGVKVRCSKCAQVFVVRKDAVAASLESIAASPQPAESQPPPPPGAGFEGEPNGGSTRELFAGPGAAPALGAGGRLSGAKDPFAYTALGAGPGAEPGLELPDTPTEDAGWAPEPEDWVTEGAPRPGGPVSAALPSQHPHADNGVFEPSEDPFDPAPPRFGPAPARAAADLGPPPLPDPEDPSVRFPAPAALTEAPGSASSPPASPFGAFADDPFAEDPFEAPSGEYAITEPSPFEVPPTPSSDVGPRPLPAPETPAGRPESAAPAGAPIALGRIAPMRVRPESADLPPADPQVARGPTPVPELKWPPRVGLLLGLVLAVLWFRPGAFDWADAALGGPGAAPVRTVALEARPYALDLDDPQWIVLGTAETRGRAYPDGLDARVRVRAGGTLVADLRVPVGLVPPVPVVADGPDAVEAYWRAEPRPPVAAASRGRFLALLPELHDDPAQLTFEVEYSVPTADGEAAVP
jgi:predicted Zn finger-like uncharacterized protein